MTPRIIFLVSVAAICLSGCAADDEPTAPDAETGDDQDFTGASIETALSTLREMLPEGRYAGTSTQGRACQVSSERSSILGDRMQITMWHTDEVDAEGAIRGGFFKFELGSSSSFRLRGFKTGEGSVYAHAEKKPSMQLVGSEKSKIWVSSLANLDTASIRIRQNEMFFGATGDDLTCANLTAMREEH